MSRESELREQVLNLSNQIRNLNIQMTQMKDYGTRQSEIIERLKRDVVELNLLKTLSTTGVLRDIGLGKDPEIQEALRKIILNQLNTSI